MFSPAAERNKEPIRKTLQSLLPQSGLLLELACGSLQHARHIAPDHPGLIWQPTDIDTHVISHGRQLQMPDNVRVPVFLDVLQPDWPIPEADVIFTSNLLHICDPAVISALFTGGRDIGAHDVLIYGPFSRNGVHTSEGNVQFDADLSRRNPYWGIRDLHDVQNAGEGAGFTLINSIEMPANNMLLHFTRAR